MRVLLTGGPVFEQVTLAQAIFIVETECGPIDHIQPFESTLVVLNEDMVEVATITD